MHSLLRTFSMLWLCSFPFFLHAQNVSITYVNPADFSVCDTVGFEVTVANTLADTLFDANLIAEMPAGISYLVGSVVNATEGNIVNLNAPMFNLDTLPPGTSATLTYRAITACTLIDAINSGELFTNIYTVNYASGSNSITTIPYVIETALLQSLSLSDQVMSGVTGDVLTRTWTITNTRLGAITNLTFTDLYADGIFITSPNGTVITQSQGTLELDLDGAFFTNFGDGDELFELNEQIVITETIEITGCGDPPQSTSFMSVSWGCHGVVCQELTTTATIAISPSDNVPNIISTIIDPLPSDYCATISHPQGVILTNTGNAPATDLAVYISHFDDGSMGLAENSLSITVGGNSIAAQVDFFNPVNFDECSEPTGIFDSIAIVIPSLDPGDTALVLWEAYVCAVDCDADPPKWRYEFYHEIDCPPGTSGTGGMVSQNFGSADLLEQEIVYYIGELLVHGGEYTLTYTLSSDLLADSTGVLRIDMDLPCGIGWGNNNGFNLNGHTPDSIEISPGSNGNDVSLYFDLPLGVDSVSSNFNIVFECDTTCLDFPECDPVYITSCPVPPPILVADVMVSASSTILLNEAECGPQSCEGFELNYDCTEDICLDTIMGYFLAELESQRKNLGLPDNNDDRQADASGNLNLNLIRRDRAITGDTILTTVNATMQMDIPGATLPNATLAIQFESHLIDDGWDGGVFMDTVNQLPLVTDSTGFINLGGIITITDVSTGDVFECPLPTPIAIGPRNAEISVVNTRPKDIEDLWYFLSYFYNITPGFLAAQGCNVPPDWEFEQGDHIEAQVFHKVMYNHYASVINMRTATAVLASNPPGRLQMEDFYCGVPYQQWQLGGYQYRIASGQYEIPPCSPSNIPGGTFFEFQLSRPNFFPFEFRSFADLLTWEYTTPNPVILLNSKIESLALQGGSTIINNAPLSWTNNGSVYSFDADNFLLATLDEGFHLRLNHEWDLPCNISDPLPLTLHALIDFAPSLPEISHPLDTTISGNATIFPAQPDLELIPVNIHHESNSNQAIWELELGNFTSYDETALNAWATIHSPSGKITGYQLINLTSGQTIIPENGIFQLGDLPPNWINDFQIVANINNCEPDLVEVTFGWDCEPYTDPSQEACHQETIVLTLSALLGEIEVAIESPVSPFQLCDTIGYHTIEIFNAQFGAVYDIELRALLPPGMAILPGTSEIAYPTGSAFQAITDPVLVNGDTALYDLAALNTTLNEDGLLGFNQAPDHSVSIRFKVATECGFVSPSQIIFNATAVQGCGLDANTLSKPGEELFIEGVTPLYDIDITISTNVPPTLSCNDNIQIDVILEPDAVTASTDSVFILVPPGLAYQPGSYQPGTNASPNDPIIDFSNNQFVLKWPLVADLQPSALINFSLIFSAVGGGECDSTVLEIVTYQLQEAECVATGELCSILAETGRKDLPVEFIIPSLGLDNVTIMVENGLVDFSLLLENTGEPATEPINIGFYLDLDASGDLSPGDQLVHTHEYLGGLGAGSSVMVNGGFNLAFPDLCNWVVAIQGENNCTCTEDVESVSAMISNTLPPIRGCASYEHEIGFPPQTGHTYQWAPSDNVACEDCSETVFSVFQNNPSPTIYEITLIDTSPTGCVVEHHQSLFLGGEALDVWGIMTYCEGETLPYFVPPGGSTSATGPGIIDSIQMTVTYTEAGDYYFTSIDSFGCVTNFTEIVDLQEALVRDTTALCEGDSVIIDNVTYFDAVETCETVTTNLGCEQIQCLFYEPRDTPILDFPLDTLCFAEGTEITIDQLGDGYSSYQWSPSDSLSCDTCAFPTLEVISQTFTVVVTDSTTCRATTEVAVIAIPACSEESIILPNVFTPNNDGTNDRFGPVLVPGVEKLITQAKLRIWDRWGNKVFEGAGIQGIYWDGQFKGKAAASEVYLFMLEMACEETEVVVKGDVTLLR